MKAYNLTTISTVDGEIRKLAIYLVKKYNIPNHLSDDFVSEAYIKAYVCYFSHNKYVSIGGMFSIINSLMLNYLKSSHKKRTINPTEEEFDFNNIEAEQFDLEMEYLKSSAYESQIDAVTSLSEEDINIILLTLQTSLRIASTATDKSIHYLRKNKKRILETLNKTI